jgi:hypothetical protein
MLVPEPRIYPPLELEFPEDRASIQINLYRIIDRLARGLMDRSTATALMYGMQVSQTNLGKTPLLEPAQPPSHSRSHDADADADSGCPRSGFSDLGPRPVSRVILTPEGDEIAPPVEILEPNAAEPIHHKGCPACSAPRSTAISPPKSTTPPASAASAKKPREQNSRAQGSGIRAQMTARGSEHRAQSTEQSTALNAQPQPTTMSS